MTETFLDRLIDEKKQLDKKINDLEVFLNGGLLNNIKPIQQKLLKKQIKVMQKYSGILHERLENI